MTGRASSRRGFLRRSGSAAIGAALLAALSCRRDRGRPPNFWIVVADDLGVDGVGCYGGGSVSTPVLDELAAKGVRFDACYATPLCTPSRVEMLTGKYPFRTGWTTNIDYTAEGENPRLRFVDPALGSFARDLRDAGYRTAAAGKWQLCHFEEHPDHVREMGFESWCFWWWTVGGKARNRYWNPAVNRDGERIERIEGAYGPDVYADHLLEFARRHRDEPLLIFHPMVLPHRPYLNPPHRVGEGQTDHRAHADPEKFPGMVEYLDRIVGRVVGGLQDLDLLRHTLLIFLADNGTPDEIELLFRGRKVRGGKGSLTERGTHVPLVAFGAGIDSPGRASAAPIDLCDLYPTLLELAGLDPPPGLDGVSLAPLLADPSARPPREWAYSQIASKRALRIDRYRYVSDGRLFDVVADPFEEKNLIADPAHAAWASRARRILTRLS